MIFLGLLYEDNLGLNLPSPFIATIEISNKILRPSSPHQWSCEQRILVPVAPHILQSSQTLTNPCLYIYISSHHMQHPPPLHFLYINLFRCSILDFNHSTLNPSPPQTTQLNGKTNIIPINQIELKFIPQIIPK